MGMFEGIEDAEIFERGKYVKGGFRGVVEVTKTIAKQTLKSGVAFIVELRVVETNMPADHPIGSKATWFQKMTDKTVAFPAIKEWAAALAGYEKHEKDEIDEEVAPHLAKTLDNATENPTDNDFVGCLVRLETEQIKTRNERDFTRYDWSPYNEVEEEPTDAVDEIGATG